MLEVKGGFLGKVPVFVCVALGNQAKLQRVAHSTFDHRKGVCYFPAYNPFIDAVVNDLQTVFKQVTFSEKAKSLLDAARADKKKYIDKVLDPNFKYKTKPYAHQEEGLLYSIYHPRVGLLYSCGLGKSKIAIDLICYLKIKTLIVVPASIISNWEEEIMVHSSLPLRVRKLTGTVEKKKKILGITEVMGLVDAMTEDGRMVKQEGVVARHKTPQEFEVLITSYETAAAYREDIMAMFPYGQIILDESHLIKNIKSQRTKGLLALGQRCHRRVIMSGTTSLGKPEDLYPQLQFLAPQIINQDYQKFRNTYTNFASWNNKIVIGYKNLDRLNKVVRRHTLRYTKEDCLDLPKRHFINRYVDMTKEQWKLYEDLLSDEDIYIDGGNVTKEHKIAALGKLNQVTGGFIYLSTKDPDICNNCHNVVNCVENGIKPYTKMCSVVQKAPPTITKRFDRNPKLEMLVELLGEILAEETNKVIIWAKYQEEIDMIEEQLKLLKLKYNKVGSDPKNDIEGFNKDPEVRVMIANVAQGTGYTANGGNYTIYYSIGMDLAHYLQSIDRNHRIGQDKEVTVYFLLAKQTIDERTIEAIENKQDIVEALLNNIRCMNCKHMHVCFLKGIRQYDPGCILANKLRRKGITV